MNLYDDQGQRLYLTADERSVFLKAADHAPREVRTFCHVLHFTGCRVSEALALTTRSFGWVGQTIAVRRVKDFYLFNL